MALPLTADERTAILKAQVDSGEKSIDLLRYDTTVIKLEMERDAYRYLIRTLIERKEIEDFTIMCYQIAHVIMATNSKDAHWYNAVADIFEKKLLA